MYNYIGIKRMSKQINDIGVKRNSQIQRKSAIVVYKGKKKEENL